MFYANIFAVPIMILISIVSYNGLVPNSVLSHAQFKEIQKRLSFYKKKDGDNNKHPRTACIFDVVVKVQNDKNSNSTFQECFDA